MNLREATDAPRIHFEDGKLNLEAGFDPKEIELLCANFPKHKIWKSKSLYFGGTNSVRIGKDGYSGAGDARRGGVSFAWN